MKYIFYIKIRTLIVGPPQALKERRILFYFLWVILYLSLFLFNNVHAANRNMLNCH